MDAGTAVRAGASAADPMTIHPAARLRGELRLPGDKSISHRALMLALLAEGTSRITGAGDGADVRSTAGVAAALGGEVASQPAAGGNVDYRVASAGAAALAAPAAELDCGNSGTSLRLFAGILAGQPFRAVLDGDASLRRRPMARIIEPLRAMGAELVAGGGEPTPPITVTGRRPLGPIDWTTPVPSAQVKSAILLAGLAAGGVTRVRERVATRDHTERMLRSRGVTVRSTPDGAGGQAIEIEGGTAVRAIDERVPGDPSAAAFWLVAGATHPDADLTLRDVGVNPTRRAIIELLRRMGAGIDEVPVPGGEPEGEPIADLRVRSSQLHGVELGPADVAAAIDEIPVLCLAASLAAGRTTIRGAGELRHKESDRIDGIARGLAAFGARIEVEGDDLTIEGRGPGSLSGAAVDSLDDHRLAMTFAVAALDAAGPSRVTGTATVAISYPSFFRDLERIRS